MPKSTRGKTYSNDDYYEAVLQLRPKDESVLNFVREYITTSKDCMIAREEETKTGYDLRLTSQQFARTLIKLLKNKIGGEVKVSTALWGINRQTSKKVYRVTFLFRKTMPPVREEIQED
jgi:NMD protein affecting ribosome stability and mRNA decay